jgi:hypothetical protein
MKLEIRPVNKSFSSLSKIILTKLFGGREFSLNYHRLKFLLCSRIVIYRPDYLCNGMVYIMGESFEKKDKNLWNANDQIIFCSELVN